MNSDMVSMNKMKSDVVESKRLYDREFMRKYYNEVIKPAKIEKE